MNWDDSNRICDVTVEGGGLSTTATLPLEEGMRGASLNYVYIGMEDRASGTAKRTYGLDNLVFYNTANNLIAEEDLGLYGVGSLVKETIAKTIEIYGETTLAPTDYIKKGLTMKVNVNYYMTDVLTDEVRGTYTHTKLNIYETENGRPYGAPVKIDGVVYVPLDLILGHLGYDYKIRENSVEISTGGTTSVCITMGSKSASVNGQRVELAGAPVVVTGETKGESYEYIVIPLDNIETFFAQEGAPNPLYVTYDETTGKALRGERVAVSEIARSSAAYGLLQIGDVINYITVDGVKYDVTRVFHASECLLNARAGSEIVYNVTRGDATKDLTVKVTSDILETKQ
jgi:hypothetical protein